MAGLEPGEAGPVGAEGGRFSVSPVNGDRPGNLLMQKEEEIRRMREMMERLQAELEKEKHTPPDTPVMPQEAR